MDAKTLHVDWLLVYEHLHEGLMGTWPYVCLCQPGFLKMAQPLGGNIFNEGSELDLFLLLP